MIDRTTLLCVSLTALACTGVARSAPPSRTFENTATVKAGPQLDPTALYRPARIGECSALTANDMVLNKAQRPKPQAKRARRAALSAASSGCNAVWSD